ncbi:hypothetical protein [Paenibacillus brevis]|uniref:Uncharacterized protein n=1 Tax=Paenibacillus brevis TaxID=2841508 RepID=A0ABS6FR39_9BACL|nr:hypothetical protein [Paenibacillus brevis]MBU5672702.1 hypothetical protein [Paenibacillus brevis]
MNQVPVMALRNKKEPDRYLAASPDVGDWSHERLDVTIDDIECAYLIARKDLTQPTLEDFEEQKRWHAAHKQIMIAEYGQDAIIGLDFEDVCENYEPAFLGITRKQYREAFEIQQQ